MTAVTTVSGIVTLLSDFGLADSYVASMKGVLLTRAPGLVLVDMTHLVPRFDIVSGAYVLSSAAPAFPRGTVHLAVVDPGVGSSRPAVAVRTPTAWFVGPDNGLLTLAAGRAIVEVVDITTVPGWGGERSATFHGRDVFAPAAAHIALGGQLEALGPIRAGGRLAPLELPPLETRPGRVVGKVVHVDGFGNAITNIPRDALPTDPARAVVEAGGVILRGLVTCYADVPAGAPCALVGSGGLLEVAVSQGDASAALGLERGATVVCRDADAP